MGADYWVDCPVCGAKNCVRIDGTHDIEPTMDGKLDVSPARGYCTQCKMVFEAKEKGYPCADCGKMRTKSEGGTTFTVCDECWEKHFKAKD